MGREEELATIASFLRSQNCIISNKNGESSFSLHTELSNEDELNTVSQAVVVSGYGGVGKTQLIAEYTHRTLKKEKDCPAQKKSHALIIWLRGGDKNSLEIDLRALATWLGFSFEPNKPLMENLPLLYRFLAGFSSTCPQEKAGKNQPRVLFVIDNADNNEIQTLLPAENLREKFSWLVTSCKPQVWKRYLSGYCHIIPLGVFKPNESIDYLRKMLCAQIQSKVDYTVDKLEELGKLLGYLPLALAQAVSYLNQYAEHKGIDYYCRQFNACFIQFLSTEVKNTYEKTVLTTWLITLPELIELAPRAIELLIVCSYLSGDSISDGLLRAYRGDIQNDNEEIALEIEQKIQLLIDYSLAESWTSKSDSQYRSKGLRQHQLLQKVIQHWVSKSLFNKSEGALKQLLVEIDQTLEVANPKIKKVYILPQLVDALIMYGEEQIPLDSDLDRRRELSPHFKKILIDWRIFLAELKTIPNVLDEKLKENHLKLCMLLYQQGAVLFELGDTNTAQIIFSECVDIVKHYYADDPIVALMIANLSVTYGSLNDAEQQKILLHQALPILQQHHGSSHPIIAIILRNLSNAYGALGDAKQQKFFLKQALNIQTRHFNSNHPDIAKTWVALASAYGTLGNIAREKALLDRALAVLESHYGFMHPTLIIPLIYLGRVCRKLGYIEQEKIYLERALPILEYYYDSMHSHLVKVLAKLSRIYHELGDETQKKILLERILPIWEYHYGCAHPKVALILVALGLACGRLGDVIQQKMLLEKALSIQDNYYGPSSHLDVAETLIILAIICDYDNLNYIPERKKLLERALIIQQAYYEPNHFRIAETLVYLAEISNKLNCFLEEKNFLKRAFIIQQACYEPNHITFLKTKAKLGIAYGKLDNIINKKELLEQVLLILEENYDPMPALAGTVLMNLGPIYGSSGNLLKQIQFLERALIIDEKYYGQNHITVGQTLVNLGYAYGDLGYMIKQKELILRAFIIYQEKYGPLHFETALVQASLGQAYGDLGDAVQQKKLTEQALLILEKHYGPVHYEVAVALKNLSEAYGKLGDLVQQKTLLERALPILKAHDNPNQSKLIQINSNPIKQDQIFVPFPIYLNSPVFDAGNAHLALTKRIAQALSDVDKILYVDTLEALEQKEYSRALRWLCTNKSEKAETLARLILSYKERLSINVNERAFGYGHTAIHYAAIRGNQQLYDLLVQHGGDENMTNASGIAAWELMSLYLAPKLSA